jgi:phytoene synthase
MADDADYCEALVKDTDKDRFLATLFAPADSRADLYVLYAFDIETAAVAQRVRDPAAGEIRLQWWHDALAGILESTGNPVADAMLETTARNGIDTLLALSLIDARRQALYPNQHQSEAEFELFASETAGAIYLMAAQVLGGKPDEATKLACHHAGVATATHDPALAQRHLGAVKSLIWSLPENLLPALLPLALAVDDRAKLPQWRKQWILWRASKNLAAWL